jgi:ligand-binding sensor domain-containing protein/two-component sensor histidine kinase
MKQAADAILRRLCGTLRVAALLAVPLAAAAGMNGVLPYSVRVWQTDDGLPQNQVYAIAQTADGYLWVGTREGLARFDGVHFTLVDEKSAPELRQGLITALCVARDGSLWVATDANGVIRWKGGAFSRFTEAEGLPSNQAHCLLESKDGSIWIGTEAGLSRHKDGKLTNFTQKQGLGHNSVRAVCEDRQGVIRVATRQGLSSLTAEEMVTNTLNFGSNFNANVLRTVCEDRRGHIWVGANEGLYCQEEGKRLAYGVAEGLPDPTVNVIYEDRSGQIWVGTYFGLCRMVEEKLISRPSSETVFGDFVRVIFEDREGNLWVGAEDGLYRLNPARFTTYTTEQGLAHNNVMSVCEDQSGTVWLGTWGGGLNALRDGKVTAYASTNVSGRDSVLAVAQRRNGSVWMGLESPPGGLERFVDGRRVPLPRQSGFINAAVRVIHEDRQGRVWIGTSSGLNMFAGGKYQAFTVANGLAGDVVHAICEDDEGNIWVGTEGGLSRRSDGKFTNFTVRDGLSQNAVDALYEDRDHALWIGTKGGGLNRLKAGKFTVYTTRQGLFSDEIYQILEDDSGYFWMSCRRGIFRVAKKELDELDPGGTGQVACTVFGKADGLLSVQCNGVAQPSGWKGRDGRLWFPTIRGVVAVETSIKANDKPPPVVIEELIADRKTVSGRSSEWTQESAPLARSFSHPFRIAPGRGEVEVRYTALSLQAPEKNRFKYMLEGVDPGWLEGGVERAARYHNLGPATYQFRVIACNNDGVWNETGAAVSFILLPHFWQTWWFRASLVGACGLVLTTLYRARVARLREIESLRIEIAANLHDDVGARLTKVAMVTEFVERETTETDPVKPHIRTIFKTTREIIRAMDEIVWTINPKNDTLDNLANYIFQYAQEYFQNTGVRCRLDVPAHLPDSAISTEARHNLFMAVKEALSNVLKHAAATEVRIGLAVSDPGMTISITDDGRGFQIAQARPGGNGLKNMKQRLEQIGGKLVVETTPGGGTTIRMETPAA